MKDWTGNKKSNLVTIGGRSASSARREEHDYYATDPRAVDALLGLECFNGAIWESACGEGHLAKRFIHHGFEVVSTDLIDRGYGKGGVNFLNQKKLLAPNIVTNPPYRYAKEFVYHACELGAEKVAMFLKITFLESMGRQRLFKAFPPKTVAVFARRIHCALNGDFKHADKHAANAACYAWYIWHKMFNGNPEITWCNNVCVDTKQRFFEFI